MSSYGSLWGCLYLGLEALISKLLLLISCILGCLRSPGREKPFQTGNIWKFIILFNVSYCVVAGNSGIGSTKEPLTKLMTIYSCASTSSRFPKDLVNTQR